MRSCVIDIESSALLADMLDYTSLPYKLNAKAKLWVVCITDVETGENFSQAKQGITKEWLSSVLGNYDFIIAHNGMKFDYISLMLFGLMEYNIGYMDSKDTLNGREVRFIDTLLLSRITNPDRVGGHGLMAWGKRVGNFKTDYREQCIEKGYIEKGSPKGSEFLEFNDLMLPYCIQDCSTTISVYKELLANDLADYDGWKGAIRQEHKLADLAIRRETFGFSFDKELAVKCVSELTVIMEDLTKKVNPILPTRKLNKTETTFYTPPKNQFVKDGSLSSAMNNFIERIGATLECGDIMFEGKYYQLPLEEPIKKEKVATIDDLDTVKSYLIELGWKPTEWRDRDFTRDSKKVSLRPENRIKAFEKWFLETTEGKYKQERLAVAFEAYKVKNIIQLHKTIIEKLKKDFAVKLPTSPQVRVGVEKELCPNLISLGEKVAFAKDFVDYLTYKHRKSCIAGGDIEDMDFDEEAPTTGYLAMYREEDGRIPTPAIEIGAATHRYRHIGVANIPRASSMYGKEMRSLFGCGKGMVQLGFDFSSLENKIQGSYVFNGTDGKLLAERLVADKPNDLHTINGEKLGITRSDAKSFTYAILYGASAKKVSKMLTCTMEKAEQLVKEFWEAVPALNELKQQKEAEWIGTGKKYIRGIDGRKINIRSQHSILNALFQSGGVIATKYTNIFLCQKLETLGYNIDCFKEDIDVAEMISYHDEMSLSVKRHNIQYKTFETEVEGKEFIKNWKGSQLSDLNFAKKWYVALPSDITEAILESIDKAGKFLNLNVELGMGWAVGNNWYQTH